MTKKPTKNRIDSPSKQTSFLLTSKDKKSFQQLNLSTHFSHKNRRFRRTISFININRKRATQFCTLKHAGNKNRRFSLGHVKKINLTSNLLKTSPKKDQKTVTTATDTLKRFKNMKQLKSTLDSLQQLKKQTIYLNVDQRLKQYIENQANSSHLNFQNEELNNKIDLEIRILDGILKLLNAICSANPSVNQNANQPNLSSISGSLGSSLSVSSSSSGSSFATSTLSSFTNISAASILINNLDISATDDVNKCTSVGAEIAAAIMSNKTSNDQGLSVSGSQSNSSTTNTLSTIGDQSDFNHIYQILCACKCLYVSHRKISIYLQNLQELEKKTISKKKHLSSSDILKLAIIEDVSESVIDKDENSAPKSATMGPSLKKTIIQQAKQKPLTKIHFNSNPSTKKVDAPIKLHDVLSIETTKLMLKDLRIPLSWKYNDHIKAIKNAENINQKFAAFAIIHLGNMIYDTQLISNIDPTVTEIFFNETFIFDDVKQNDFLITIELYSYELFNTASNLIQSARKLAKQLTEFATFKKTNNNQQQQQLQQQQQQQLINGTAQLTQSTNSILPSNNYSYSMHKFKLIAKSQLTHKDVSEFLETRSLDIINEPNRIKNSDSDLGNKTINANNFASLTASNNKLPLFDYYSCCLCVCPTSTYI